MLSTKSIRGEFTLKLLPAVALLVFIFSYVVYSLIGKSIYDDIRAEMTLVAKESVIKLEKKEDPSEGTFRGCVLEKLESGFDVATVLFEKHSDETGDYMTLYYPYSHADGSGLKISRNITTSVELLEKIKNIILILNVIAIIGFIPFFSYTISIFLARPIKNLSLELASMNENSIGLVDQNRLPVEFSPLGKTLNRLLRRLQGHIEYQRELFTGIAHELKTPLAVIRAKNDVTLLKERTVEKYQEVLRHTNSVVDEMNKMTGTVLEIGRAEYAQFDKPEVINISQFLKVKIDGFKALAEKEKRVLVSSIKPDALMFLTQPTLISHILQNLIVNAIKFTPIGKTIEINSYLKDGHFVLEVLDEGRGIEDSVDLFAPFIAKGENRGVGLGLYLAKNAAIALNGSLSLQNRVDKSGAVATLILEYVKPSKKEQVL